MRYDINDIKKVLPHRYPFLLVDRVLECDGEYVKAIKNVTANEPFFNGHFPNEPVMPGVLMIEALAQTACFLAHHHLKDNWTDNMGVFFSSIDKVKFRRIVIPGDQLLMEANLIKRKRDFWWMDGKITVDGELVIEACLSAVVRRDAK